MNGIRIPLGEWVEALVGLLTGALGGAFEALRGLFLGMYTGMEWLLATPPFWVIVLALAAVGFAVKGWKFALGAALGLLLIVSVDQWDNAMETLALVLVASAVAIAISVPVGVAAAKSPGFSAVVRPVLDFMQTTPAFVYLIPALLLFRVGVVPGIVATIIFALAPGVRLTELGIRGVDREVVEAGHAFGSSPWRILRQIELPLALPSIMAGVNQVIMLSLSMVVIAGMVGAGGLGADVVASLSRIDLALGAEAGVSVVILAILLDRLTAALGAGRVPVFGWRRLLAGRRTARPAQEPALTASADAR